jgi:hypothetical protein
MMVDAMGYLDPSAQEQLAVISGLMRGVYGDLMEVYTYYALLGKQLVVADRWVASFAPGIVNQELSWALALLGKPAAVRGLHGGGMEHGEGAAGGGGRGRGLRRGCVWSAGSRPDKGQVCCDPDGSLYLLAHATVASVTSTTGG